MSEEIPAGLTIAGRVPLIEGPHADGGFTIGDANDDEVHYTLYGEWVSGGNWKQDCHATRAAAINHCCWCADLPPGWQIIEWLSRKPLGFVIRCECNGGASMYHTPIAAYLAIQTVAGKRKGLTKPEATQAAAGHNGEPSR